MDTFTVCTLPDAKYGEQLPFISLTNDGKTQSLTLTNTLVTGSPPHDAIAILLPDYWLIIAGAMLSLMDLRKIHTHGDTGEWGLFTFYDFQLTKFGLLETPSGPNLPGICKPELLAKTSLVEGVEKVRMYFQWKQAINPLLFIPLNHACGIVPYLPHPRNMPEFSSTAQVLCWNMKDVSPDKLMHWATTLDEIATYGRS